MYSAWGLFRVFELCDGLLGAIPEHTWIVKMKSSMNQSILKNPAEK